MNIAIFGTGNMGKAIIGGLKKAYAGDVRVVAWDKSPGALEGLADGVEVVGPSEHEWKSADFKPDVVIVSVKPADVLELLCDSVAPLIKGRGMDFLTISVAAGISIHTMRMSLGDTARVCRVMPNTPAMIGEGMSAYALSDNCPQGDSALVEYVFNACGKVVSVSEHLMDAVTGLSGSGPAFAYSFIEALAEGGVSAGLSYKMSMELAVQTVVGAARMVQATMDHPSVLRSRVMSPGGTTVKGLEALERAAFKSTVMSAVAEAAAQSARMSGGK